MTDLEEAYALARANAVQAQRLLDAAEALVKERRQQLREALALVTAREPMPTGKEVPSQ